jgi:hypothetical protein
MPKSGSRLNGSVARQRPPSSGLRLEEASFEQGVDEHLSIGLNGGRRLLPRGAQLVYNLLQGLPFFESVENRATGFIHEVIDAPRRIQEDFLTV